MNKGVRRKSLWRESLDDYVSKAKWGGLSHPQTRVLWCYFVVKTLRAKKPLSHEELKKELSAAGISEDDAKELADTYEAQREILLYDRRGPKSILPPWPKS